MQLFWIYWLHQITWVPGRTNLLLLLVNWSRKKEKYPVRITFSSRTGQPIRHYENWQKRTPFLQNTPQWLLLAVEKPILIKTNVSTSWLVTFWYNHYSLATVHPFLYVHIGFWILIIAIRLNWNYHNITNAPASLLLSQIKRISDSHYFLLLLHKFDFTARPSDQTTYLYLDAS